MEESAAAAPEPCDTTKCGVVKMRVLSRYIFGTLEDSLIQNALFGSMLVKEVGSVGRMGRGCEVGRDMVRGI